MTQIKSKFWDPNEKPVKNNEFEGYNLDKVKFDLDKPLKVISEPLTDPQIKDLLSRNYKGDYLRTRCMLHLFMGAGLRVSELSRLRVADIDFNERVLRVLGKGNKQRKIPVPKVVIESLYEYLSDWGKKLQRGAKMEFVFSNYEGKPLSRDWLYKLMRNVGQKCGIHLNPHRLRHTYATRQFENGMDIESLRRLLGHSTYRVTEEYLHLSTKYLKDKVDKYNFMED